MPIDGLLGPDVRKRCAALAQECRTLSGRIGADLFSQPPEAAAKVLTEIADLRAQVLNWDGYYAVQLASGRPEPEDQELAVLVMSAVEEVEAVLLSIRQQWLAVPADDAGRLLEESGRGAA